MMSLLISGEQCLFPFLVQEGARRLRNMDPHTSWDQKLPLLNKLMVQMLWAGYSRNDREIISERILANMTMTCTLTRLRAGNSTTQ